MPTLDNFSPNAIVISNSVPTQAEVSADLLHTAGEEVKDFKDRKVSFSTGIADYIKVGKISKQDPQNPMTYTVPLKIKFYLEPNISDGNYLTSILSLDGNPAEDVNSAKDKYIKIAHSSFTAVTDVEKKKSRLKRSEIKAQQA
jgi:hypothetical protein